MNWMLSSEGVFTPLGHISARTLDGEHFYLNKAMCPAVVEGDPNRRYKEVEIHRAIYANRKDVNTVVHHHAEEIMPYIVPDVTFNSRDNQANSAVTESLPTFSDYGQTSGRLIVERAEGERMAQNLGDVHAQFLELHGANVGGRRVGNEHPPGKPICRTAL